MTTLNKLLSARWLTKKAPSAQSSQAQNKRQIEQMYHTHYVKLRGYAHRLTRSEERAMDLIQDTFVRAHKYLHTFDGQYELSWLKKIMYHIHIDNMSEETKKRAIRGGPPNIKTTSRIKSSPLTSTTPSMITFMS